MNRPSPLALFVTCVVALTSAAGPVRAQDVAHVYWAETRYGGIHRAHADGTFRERLTRNFEIGGIDYDAVGGWLYLSGTSGRTGHTIYRAKLDGSQRQLLVTATAMIVDMTLDLVNGKLYWAQRTSGFHQIVRRSDLDGSNPETIVDPARVFALDVDATGGKVYWLGTQGIKRSNLDGSGEETLDGSFAIGDLVIDEVNATLYHADEDSLQICSITPFSCTEADAADAVAVRVVGTTVYYRISGAGDIWRMDLDGQNQQQVTIGVPENRGFVFEPGANEFYFADANVFRTAADGSNPTPVLSEVSENVHDVAVDVTTARFYTVVDQEMGNVVFGGLEVPRTNALFPGTTQQAVLSDVRGIALDDAAGDLYVVVFGVDSTPSIVRIGTDGSGPDLLVDGLMNPHDIALDVVAGKMYWTTAIDEEGSGAKIQRADLDGTNVEDVLADLPKQVRGIDVDAVGGKVYWTDMAAGEIRRANLDGSSPETVLGGLVKPHDIALDPGADRLYWIGNIADADDPIATLGRATMDGGSPVTVRDDLSQHARDLIVVYHPSFGILEDGFESGDTTAWTPSP